MSLDNETEGFSCGTFAGLGYGRSWIVVDLGNGLHRQHVEIMRLTSLPPAYGSEGREFESLRAHQKSLRIQDGPLNPFLL